MTNPYDQKKYNRIVRALEITILIILILMTIILFFALVPGCTGQQAKEGGATQGAGFQSASGNKLEMGDIGDKVGGDMQKDQSTEKLSEVAPQATQTAGIQYGKTVVNDVWAIVLFFLGFVLLREGFSYLRMRLKP